jgi:hypothetical protein
MTSVSDTGAVRRALYLELEGRGHVVAGDTVALRGELYVRGEGDRAAALFEFKSSVEEAVETMYQGSWTTDLPPRFAVLPFSQRDHSEVELLRQAGMKTLFYEAASGEVVFADLDAALEVLGAARAREKETS